MARYILSLQILFFGLASHTAFAAGVCDAVLNPLVFNTGSTSKTLAFASNFKDQFCRQKWTTSADLQNRSTYLGFD